MSRVEIINVICHCDVFLEARARFFAPVLGFSLKKVMTDEITRVQGSSYFSG